MSCGSPMPRGEQIAKPAEWGHPRGRFFFFPKAVRAPVPVPNIPRTRKRSCPMRRLTLLFCLAALAAPALDAQEAPAPATTSARRRVAVLDFDYGTVHSYVTDIWGSDVDIGKGIANMLLTELVQNGTYTLIERTQVDRILNEQNLQQEGRADASTAAKLGRLLGGDAVIIGSLNQFGRGAQDSGDHRRDHGARRRRDRERADHQRRDGRRGTDRYRVHRGAPGAGDQRSRDRERAAPRDDACGEDQDHLSG